VESQERFSPVAQRSLRRREHRVHLAGEFQPLLQPPKRDEQIPGPGRISVQAEVSDAARRDDPSNEKPHGRDGVLAASAAEQGIGRRVLSSPEGEKKRIALRNAQVFGRPLVDGNVAAFEPGTLRVTTESPERGAHAVHVYPGDNDAGCAVCQRAAQNYRGFDCFHHLGALGVGKYLLGELPIEEIVRREGEIDPAEPLERRSAKASPYRIADQKRPDQHGRADDNPQHDGDIGAPVVAKASPHQGRI